MLSPDRWHQIDALFDEALDVAPEARPAFLDDRCPRELRASVDALLRGSTQPEASGPARGCAARSRRRCSASWTAVSRSRAGPSRRAASATTSSIRLLGEGGMGEVWEAEQTGPVRRRVALKVVKAGMETKRVTARFDSERQALALMDHPNVAQVFGGGTAPSGRPYFVMELVARREPRAVLPRPRPAARRAGCASSSRSATACSTRTRRASSTATSSRRTSSSERDGQPQPKIIDFGVARALDERHAPGTTLTEQGQIVGTLEYMSPEQADFARATSTRAPTSTRWASSSTSCSRRAALHRRALPGRDYVELLRNIRETDPPRPSLRADARAARELRGDLDWIVMKAIEKDRERRYDSAHELAEDVRRHLASEPVPARRRADYRVRKLVRRHRATVAGAALATSRSSRARRRRHQAVRAARAERAARADADRAQFSEFLVELFEVSDPALAKRETVTARGCSTAVRRGSRGELADQPLVRARLETVVGEIYRKLGLYDPARSAAGGRAPRSASACWAPTTRRPCAASSSSARLHPTGKDADRAEALLRQTLARLARTPDEAARGTARGGSSASCSAGRRSSRRRRCCTARPSPACSGRTAPRISRSAGAWQDVGNTPGYANRLVEAEDASQAGARHQGGGHLRPRTILEGRCPPTWVASLAVEDGRSRRRPWTLARRALADPGEGARTRPPLRRDDARRPRLDRVRPAEAASRREWAESNAPW